MTCLSCGAKDPEYTVNGYGLCDSCRQTILFNHPEPVWNHASALREYNDDISRNERNRVRLAAAIVVSAFVFCLGILWAGGLLK